MRIGTRGTIFCGNIHHLASVGSTNTEAMRLASEGAPEGTVVLADEQTAGRGRGGHAWHSEPEAGIYCSVVLRPKLPPSDVLWLSLSAGLAAHGAIKQMTGVDSDLRWPNDLLIAEKKFCGILTELSSDAEFVRHAVVGIGINVNHAAFPSEIADLATSLRIAAGSEWPRTPLIIALLQSLDREYRILQDAPDLHRAIVPRVEAISTYVRGKRVQVTENGGYDGVTAGLDRRGFLQVQTGSGMRAVISGGVRAVHLSQRS